MGAVRPAGTRAAPVVRRKVERRAIFVAASGRPGLAVILPASAETTQRLADPRTQGGPRPRRGLGVALRGCLEGVVDPEVDLLVEVELTFEAERLLADVTGPLEELLLQAPVQLAPQGLDAIGRQVLVKLREPRPLQRDTRGATPQLAHHLDRDLGDPLTHPLGTARGLQDPADISFEDLLGDCHARDVAPGFVSGPARDAPTSLS